MAFSGNNQLVYNAAFNAALAGQLAQQPLVGASPALTATSPVYVALAAVASAFAKAVDAAIGNNVSLATGAAGTTVPPTTALITATQGALVGIVYAVCLGFWNSRAGAQLAADAGATSTDYTAIAAQVLAIFTAASTAYAAAPGGTSLS
jgi:hypothetical protein